MKRFIQLTLCLIVAGSIFYFTTPDKAWAVPALARKYETGCTQCHTLFPKLNRFGENFKQNGYQTPFANEETLGKVDVKDDTLALLETLPIALRWAGALQSNRDPNPAADFTFPEGLMLLSVGTIYPDVGFLIHHGIDSGFEKGYLVINNIGNLDLDVQIGQFEIMDFVFSGHRTLTRTGYAIYGTMVGNWMLSAAQRGITVYGTIGSTVLPPRKKSEGAEAVEASASDEDELEGLEEKYEESKAVVKAEEKQVEDINFEERNGFFYQLAFINGNRSGHEGGGGVHAHGSSVTVDSNDAKDFFANFYQTFGNNSRIGAFGYFGENKLTDTTTKTAFTNEFRRLGADLSLNFGREITLFGTTKIPRWNLHALYVKGDDDHPSLAVWDLDHRGGFVGMEYYFDGRNIGSLRYDFVDSSDDPTLDTGLLTFGYSRAVLRNLKLGVELTADLENNSPTHPNDKDVLSVWIDVAF